MPFTLAHPAAAVPLRRRLGRYGTLSLLLIGSMARDLAYFLPVGVSRAQSPALARALAPLLAIVALLAGPRAAAAPAESEIPEALRAWIPWVMAAHPDARCPLRGDTERVCAWPARLVLDLETQGGRFSQAWQVFGRGFAALPGGAGVWPDAVEIDGRPAAVMERSGQPALWLEPGSHHVSGRFAWPALPRLLPVPPEVGLLRLSLDGEPVSEERREPDGRLWLAAGGPNLPVGPVDAAHADVDVRRLLRDSIPLELTTRFDLDVAGASRELRIGRAVLPGFVAVSLESPLPAQIEPSGDLVLQVRPGRYAITLVARHEGPVLALTLLPDPEAAGDAASAATLYDDEEVWAFQAEPSLRVVELSGAEAVDPQQTTLPPEWRGLPAFLLTPGVTLRFAERRRGDADPAPDALTLRRRLWLDFDGGGYTVSDRIGGELHRTWRLEAGQALALGRVAVGGVDQPITMLPAGDARGVELRETHLAVDADARLEGVRGRLPASGWSHDFQDVAATLELPPGWRLLFASGVDDAAPTWVGSWTLLDLFFVLVIALAIGRLLGRSTGALALAAFVLAWLEPGAPRWPWAAVIAAEALVRALPDGAIRRGMRLMRLALLVVLVVAVVGFVATNLRTALYPALERPWARAGEGAPAGTPIGVEPASPAETRGSFEGGSPDERMLRLEQGALPSQAPEPGAASRQPAAEDLAPGRRAKARYAPDPTIPVTTGPGLPEWRWRQVDLTWRGPVRASQALSLVLLSPTLGFVLAWLRAALIAALVVALLRAALGHRHDAAPPAGAGGASPGGEAASEGAPGGASPHGALPGGGTPGGKTPSAAPASARVALALALLLAAPLAAARAEQVGADRAGAERSSSDLPGASLLRQLEQRLLAPPPCAPQCATIGRLRVEATPDVLRLRIEAAAAAESAIPLPGGAGHWLPDDVLIDGEPARALRRERDGTLWIALMPGPHQIVLQGRIGRADAVDLPLPLAPQRVERELSGFVLEGVRDDGRAESSLRLVREAVAPSEATAPPKKIDASDESPALPPFFHVVRRLSLGLALEVTTQVLRATPPGVAAALAVPLLPGESVTNETGRVEDGRLLVSLAPGDTAVSWRSVLEPAAALDLAAPADVPWVETWVVDASPLWHVEATGLAPILADEPGVRLRTYRPWPGESVRLALMRPVGIAGATLTIDRSALTVTPGRRATDVELALTLRSSRGGQHAIGLPAGAELLDVTIDGRRQPLRLDAGKLLIPLEPRAQRVELRWREAQGVRARLRTPAVDLGAPSVNAHVSVAMPLDRWTLLTSGPALGPAVLFWSLLAILVPLAFGLARVALTPLGVASWLLLGVGLTQAPVAAGAVVTGWLLALGWRGRRAAAGLADHAFRLTQVGLVVLTLVALAILFYAIQRGLLGLPEMQIAGNGSRADDLRWYQDRAPGLLPQASVLSVPLWAYRLAMLGWALWLAASLVGWLRWGWAQLGVGGYWRARAPKRGIDLMAAPSDPTPTDVGPGQR